MKTKFILVGGYPHKGENNGKNFYEELVVDRNEPTKILVCLFARPKDNWETAFTQDVDFFQKNLPNKKIAINLASEENFIEELKWCDVIYFRGGDIDLIKIMEKFSDWKKMLDGKTVAGSSMGAYMLSKYYYDIVTNIIKNGSGATSSKAIVHWKSELPEYSNTHWEEGLNKLKEYKEDLPTYNLAEGEFVVLYNL